MKNAVLSVIVVLVFASLVGALKPKGSLGKGISFLCSLFVLATLISPFFDMEHIRIELSEGADQSTSEGASGWLVENSALQIGKSVSELVKQKYGYDAPVTVTLDTSDVSAVRLVSVFVDLREFNTVSKVYEIEAELEENLACRVEVLVR